MKGEYKTMTGFGNQFSTESLPGALPIGRNSPQKPAYGLVAELISGSAFTAPRSHNLRSWLYRIRPSVVTSLYKEIFVANWKTAPDGQAANPTPQPLRWDPIAFAKKETKFLDGVNTWLTAGDVNARTGSSVHLYSFNSSMGRQAICNADGDLLFVAQHGGLRFLTEFGWLKIEPGEICVIPRGIKFKVELTQELARGYMLEVYGDHLELPQLGPIGSNGLANPRDFHSPVAYYEENHDQGYELYTKYCGKFFCLDLDHSPFDVVAWHGNYVPYTYDLRLFNTINTVSFDHPDPSIFTVLTSPSGRPGTANVDFVIFPPRWMVAEDTFRPPYFHRNVMSEYMGLIYGSYDAKPAGGFEPGSGSLHSCMSPHGPEKLAYEAAIASDLKPEYQADTLAFMFETNLCYRPSQLAMEGTSLQSDYHKCWQGIPVSFKK